MTQPPLYPPKPVQTIRQFIRARLDGYSARQLVREQKRRRAKRAQGVRRRGARGEQERLVLEAADNG